MEIIYIVIAAIVAIWWFGFGRTIESLSGMAQSQVELMADKQHIQQMKFYNTTSISVKDNAGAAKKRAQLRQLRTASLDDIDEMLAELEDQKPETNRPNAGPTVA
jgi:hypothetical protein